MKSICIGGSCMSRLSAACNLWHTWSFLCWQVEDTVKRTDCHLLGKLDTLEHLKINRQPASSSTLLNRPAWFSATSSPQPTMSEDGCKLVISFDSYRCTQSQEFPMLFRFFVATNPAQNVNDMENSEGYGGTGCSSFQPSLRINWQNFHRYSLDIPYSP